MTEKNKLEIDEAKAEVVREIFALYCQGYGYLAIARQLEEKKYSCPASKFEKRLNQDSWNAVAVQRILKNRVYTGDTIQGVSEKVSFKSKKTRRLDEENWIIVGNTHQPIITKEIFENVQKIILSRKLCNERNKGEIHFFRGIIFCGRCNSIMFARKRRNSMGYICSGYAKNGKSFCSSHYVREKDLSQAIINEIVDLFKNEEVQKKLIPAIEEHLKVTEKNEKNIYELEKQLQTKRNQQNILYFDRLEGRITEQLFERINNNIEEQLSSIIKKIKNVEERRLDIVDPKEIISKTLKYIEQNGINYEIVRLFVERVTIYDVGDKIDHVYKSANEKGYNEEQIRRQGGIVLELKL